VLIALARGPNFAMARVIPNLARWTKTENFYVLFMGLVAAPVAAVRLRDQPRQPPRDGLAGIFLGAGVLALVGAGDPGVELGSVHYHQTGGRALSSNCSPAPGESPGYRVVLLLSIFTCTSARTRW